MGGVYSGLFAECEDFEDLPEASLEDASDVLDVLHVLLKDAALSQSQGADRIFTA